MPDQSLIDYARQFDIVITPAQSELLRKNMSLVLEYNQKINLTAITDREAFIDKHLIDSLLCPIKTRQAPLNIIDIGTGGGFPGIPLAIVYPMHHFTLMDSTAKKLTVVKRISEALGLRNVSFLEGRAEVLGHERRYREKFDMVVSRGVASYPVLLELCIPFLKTGGVFCAWKGQHYETEVHAAENALKTLNLSIREIKKEILIKTGCFHVIICAEKNGTISEQYPRNFGAIKKKPL